MRPLKTFEEFLKYGTVRRRRPDMSRARSLAEEAERRKKFLQEMLSKMGISDANANYYIENSYDTLIELLRAKLLLEGFDSSGKGAHEAEVAYMRNMDFSEHEVRFMNDLRYFRNGIKYYGKPFDTEYGKKVLDFLNKTYPKLLAALKRT